MRGEEVVEPARRLDHLGEAVVGLGDRLDTRLRPVAVGVVVVVRQREQQEVEEVLLDQLRRAAGRVAVAAAGDRGRLAGHLAAGVEVAVEELARAPGVVAELEPGRLDRAPHQSLQRDLVAVAATVDQERRAGGAGAGVVEALEQRLDLRAEVGQVHVVDEVVERPEDAEGPGRVERGAVLDVAPLEPVVPVHAADPVALGGDSGDHLRAGDRRHRGEAGDAVLDQHAALDQRREGRRPLLGDRPLAACRCAASRRR